MNKRLYSILAPILILVIFACNINNPFTPPTPTAVPLLRALSLSVQAQNAIDSSTTAGQAINYQFVVTNTGNVPLVGPVTVTDDKIMVTCPNVNTVGNLNDNLDPNEMLTCTGLYTLSQADLTTGSVTNNASASAAGTNSNPATTSVSTAGINAAFVASTPQATPTSSFVPGTTIQHKVERGDWLIQIARCYGADYKATRRANPQIFNPSVISINSIVTVPNIGSNGNMYGPPCVKFHTVQAGDTWTSIAQLYNADVVVLQAANRGVSLTAGRVVKVPVNSAGGSPQPPPPGYKTLTINVTGSGAVTSSQPVINCGTTCKFVIADNTAVTLNASAISPSTFAGWNGAGCTGTGTCQVTMNTDQTVTANFTSPVTTKNLTVNITTGSGTVTSNPAGINCPTVCTAPFAINTPVTLTASPTAPATSASLSGGNCTGAGTCQVTVNADLTVTASFSSPSATKKLTVTIAGAGTVTSPPPGINCSSNSTCSFDFPASTSVTLTASPIAPSTFAGWSGSACSGPTLVCIVSMTGDQNATATFNPPNSQTVPTTITLSDVTTPLTAGRPGSFSGQVTADPAVPDGQLVDLQFRDRGCGPDNLFSRIPTDTKTSSGDGSFNGNFTAPSTAGTYGFRVSFLETANIGGKIWQSSSSGCQEIVVNPALQSQAITVTIGAPANAIYDTSFQVAATASSGLPVAITTTGLCGISSGGTGSASIKMTSGTGTCTVHYNQAGDTTFSAAPEATNSTTAQKKDQTINITTPAPQTVVNNESFTVVASSDSGLPVAITASDDCSGNGNGSATIKVTLAQGSDGTCIVHYNQAGDANYKAAAEKSEAPQVHLPPPS